MEKNEILMIHGTEYQRMTRELLEAADLAAHIPAKGARIGIKPNLVSPSEASFGATTHPEVVAGILEYLQAHGFSNLVMLEGSWVGDRTEEAVRLCGYDRLSRHYGVPFLDMQKEKGRRLDCAGMELTVCESAAALDFLINVPVLKGHCQTKLTCALKNLKGLLPNSEKRRFHALGLHLPIAHLSAGIRQDFIVADNICGDLDFEDGGHPVVTNRILAAADPVLLDAYACEFLHYDCAEVPYIGLAERLGVGSADLAGAKIRALNAPKRETAVSRRRKVVEVQDQVEEVESCSACYGYLLPALDLLREEGLFQKLDTKICIGQGFRGKTGTLGIGNCTGGFACSLPGCPPTEGQIYAFLKEYIGQKQE